MEKNIEVVKFAIRTLDENSPAFLVAIGADGREYEWVSSVHVHGENHEVDTRILQGCKNCSKNAGVDKEDKCNYCGC